MNKQIILSTPVKKSSPPLLLAVLGLVGVVGFACFLGIETLRSVNNFRAVSQSLQAMWDDRVTFSSLPDQEAAKAATEQDKAKLQQITDEYRALYRLVSLGIGGLVGLVLLAFACYRLGFVGPLRKLEQSCHDSVANDLKGLIWGTDRDDQLGSLARSINTIRTSVGRMSDMVVEAPDGTKSHIHFEGKGGAVFNALVDDLQAAVKALQNHSQKLEDVTVSSEQKLLSLNDNVERQSSSLEAAVDSTRIHMASLQGEWQNKLAQTLDQSQTQLQALQGQVQDALGKTVALTEGRLEALHSAVTGKIDAIEQVQTDTQAKAQALVEKFQQDMKTLQDVALATGQRVAQTVSSLSISESHIKKAAQQSLVASSSFATQAAELHEKLSVATTMFKASGKVMAETTQAARTRLLEAVTSVENADGALRAFLDDTTRKTASMAGFMESMAGSAEKAGHTVEAFDTRMAQFEERSGVAFGVIEQSAAVMTHTSGQLETTHRVMQGALDAMQGHTTGLAGILATIRDEYAGFTQNWRAMVGDVAPSIGVLKDAAHMLHSQMRDEWTLYTQQSRDLLGALEHDVRAMNARTQEVTNHIETLVGTVGGQTQRLADSANHFDLQIAGLSQRIEAAAGSVMRSNDEVLRKTAGQIDDVHSAVADMVQRLGILSQLTGTLGAVAGQLGQIVPNLSAPRAPALPAAGLDQGTLQHFETMRGHFDETLSGLKTEFDVVRGQINSWVAMITEGYKQLNKQMGALDVGLEERLRQYSDTLRSAMREDLNVTLPALMPPPVQPVPAVNLGEQLMPALRLIHEGLEKNHVMDHSQVQALQMLQNHVQNMAADAQQTVRSLQNLAGFIEQGFDRVAQQNKEPTVVKVDMARVESTAQYLEAITLALKAHAGDLVNKLGTISGGLADTYGKLDARISAPAPIDTPDDMAGGSHLDRLQAQIEKIAAVLDSCAAQTADIKNAAPEKPRQIVESVMTAISRLHQIAESIERAADQTDDVSEKAI